jgi:phosphoribosylanthranilate isomerase
MNKIPRIKICGITRKEDALFAASLGVDALGFIFAKSPRQVTQNMVQEIIEHLPPFVSTVGVFVDEDPNDIRQISRQCRLDWIQLHGNESPQYCNDLGLKVLKAIRVRDWDSVDTMAPYKPHVQGFVLDTYVKGKKGGTGKTFDWTLAKHARKYGPIIIAGGLTPESVTKAIELATPYGVDVSSGVESAPGVKDHDALKRFVQRLKQHRNKEEK